MSESKPFRPTLVTGVLDLSLALYTRRDDLALTAEEVDDLAGFHERYTGKLEQPLEPWGRGSLRLATPSEVYPAGHVRMTAMGAIWLETLGLRLVLMSAEDAARIDAQPTPAKLSGSERYHRAVLRRRVASASK